MPPAIFISSSTADQEPEEEIGAGLCIVKGIVAIDTLNA